MKHFLRITIFILASIGLVVIIQSCRKKPTIPVLTTTSVSGITPSSAVSGGNITDDGGAEITARGVCWCNTSQTPTTADSKTEDGSGKGMYTSNLTGLYPGNKYIVRAYAVNSQGTAYGDNKDFVTDQGIIFNPDLTYGTLSDIDGNTYKTIQIGAQIWMAENLRTTKFNDGAQIPLTVDNNAWISLAGAGYCWYDNNEYAYKAVYGALYNWMAVNSGKLCPTGWHVPLTAEWTTLSDQLDGVSVAGGKIKETGLTHWVSPNQGATNSSGFTGLPGGYRNTSIGAFSEIGNTGIWWSSTESSPTTATTRNTNATYASMGSYNNQKPNGFSVRCVKD
jgi:uncharacterized protein (TIGR02145 family)